MTRDFEGDWSKPFPPLKKLNDDGVKNLAIGVIDQAVKSVYRIETKRWKHKLSIGVCSASDAEMRELRDRFYFFRDDFQFYAELAGLEIDWKKSLLTIIKMAHERAKKEVPGVDETTPAQLKGSDCEI